MEQDIKLHKKIERFALLGALIIPMVIMLGIFVAYRIYPFGDRSFLASDMYHQYMPFFREMMHKIRAGESLAYSYHVGIGSNFLALFVYYLASPVYLLALLVPEALFVEFLSYIVVLKIGLAGLTAYLYLRRHFENSDWKALLFSMFYALSGYMAAYDFNIMWIDPVVLLPLVLLGLEKLVKESKCGLYCVTLALSIFSNFYISIMLCVFLVMYFIVLIINEKCNYKTLLNFALYSLLAGGMASILLIPEVCALSQTDFGDMNFPKTIKSYFSILEVLPRHFACVSTERGLDHWPNIFCGSAVLLLIPMYVLNRKISLRQKITKLAVLGFMLVSFSVNILDFIWHGMNYPDSFPARQSFLYIFLVITLCYEAFVHLKDAPRWHILCGYLVAVVTFVLSVLFITHEDFRKGVKLLTLLLVTGYAVLLWLYRSNLAKQGEKNSDRIEQKCTDDERTQKFKWILGVLALALVIGECAGNTALTRSGTVNRTSYLQQLPDYRALADEVTKKEQGQGIYRFEKFVRKTKNDATLAGYPSASVFSSTLNSQVMDMYKKFGMRNSKVYYAFDGATPLTSALLNVKYMFGDSDKYENELFPLLDNSGEVYLYECAATLPFGYVAPVGFDLPEDISNHGIRIQTELVQALGIEGKLFHKKERTEQGDDILFTAPEDGVYYGIVTSVDSKQIKLIGGPLGEETYKDIKSGALLYLGDLEESQEIRLTNANEKDETPKITVDVYRLDMEVLKEALDALSTQHMEDVNFDSDSLIGSVHMNTAGRLILSIPYEKGWRIEVNGEQTEPGIFGGALIALDLEAGEYDIEMHYVPVGKWAGIFVTLGSVMLFVLLMIYRRKHPIEVNHQEPKEALDIEAMEAMNEEREVAEPEEEIHE